VVQGVTDFNRRRKPDFLLRNTSTGTGFVWFFNDAAPIGDQFLFGMTGVEVEAVADVNADGPAGPDVPQHGVGRGLRLEHAYSGGPLSLGTSSPRASASTRCGDRQWADYNGDGKPDLLFRNRDTGLVFVWYMDGTTLHQRRTS
jgi:hypothetical protein